MNKHIGQMEISDELILKFLDFNDGGKVLAIYKDNWNTVKIQIEHPDMPEIKEGDTIKTVCPSYSITQDDWGNKFIHREKLDEN